MSMVSTSRWKRNALLTLVCLWLLSGSVARADGLPPKPVFYAGALYVERQDGTRDYSEGTKRCWDMGMQPCCFVVATWILGGHAHLEYRWNDPSTHKMPSFSKLDERLQLSIPKPDGFVYSPIRPPIVLNIEHVRCWYRSSTISKKEEARVGRDYLRDIVKSVKAHYGYGQAVGLFSMVPQPYTIAVDRTYITEGEQESLKENHYGLDAEGNKLPGEGLADAVDFVAPQCYVTDEPTPSEMYRHIELGCKQARMYGKPIYPFIWYRRHPQHLNKTLPDMLTEEEFAACLRACDDHADGAFFFTGMRPWNDDAVWIKAFKKRMQLVGAEK